jgi:hypothetical protein
LHGGGDIGGVGHVQLDRGDAGDVDRVRIAGGGVDFARAGFDCGLRQALPRPRLAPVTRTTESLKFMMLPFRVN